MRAGDRVRQADRDPRRADLGARRTRVGQRAAAHRRGARERRVGDPHLAQHGARDGGRPPGGRAAPGPVRRGGDAGRRASRASRRHDRGQRGGGGTATRTRARTASAGGSAARARDDRGGASDDLAPRVPRRAARRGRLVLSACGGQLAPGTDGAADRVRPEVAQPGVLGQHPPRRGGRRAAGARESRDARRPVRHAHRRADRPRREPARAEGRRPRHRPQRLRSAQAGAGEGGEAHPGRPVRLADPGLEAADGLRRDREQAGRDRDGPLR